MAVLNYSEGWLFLAEGYTGSRACVAALQEIEGSEVLGGHHESWPSLKKKQLLPKKDLLTFSVVRHPLDIIATQCAKGSNHPPSCWLIRTYKHKDPFYCHRCEVTLRYEEGLRKGIENVIQQPLCLEHLFPTPDKKPWKEIFSEEDLKFAYATIPELFTLGYVDWYLKSLIRPSDITNYLEKYVKWVP